MRHIVDLGVRIKRLTGHLRILCISKPCKYLFPLLPTCIGFIVSLFFLPLNFMHCLVSWLLSVNILLLSSSSLVPSVHRSVSIWNPHLHLSLFLLFPTILKALACYSINSDSVMHKHRAFRRGGLWLQ